MSAEWEGDGTVTGVTPSRETTSGRRFRVEYRILSGCDNFTEPVRSAHVVVEAADAKAAGRAACAWVHDNDTYADPRIDPLVEIVEVEPYDGDEEEDEEDDERRARTDLCPACKDPDHPTCSLLGWCACCRATMVALEEEESAAGGEELGRHYLEAMVAPRVLSEADQAAVAELLGRSGVAEPARPTSWGKYQVDTDRPRWVLATPGEAPLAERLIAFGAERAELAEVEASLRGENRPYEVVEVVGPEAAQFPLEGERPRYWEFLHPADELVGEVAAGIEVYRRGGELLIVDDTGPGSPEAVGALADGLGPRPADPDDAGVDEEDPAWMEMSDRDLAWLESVEDSGLARALATMGALGGWFFVEALRQGGYQPGTDSVEVWLADRAGRLSGAGAAPGDEPASDGGDGP